MEKPADEIVCKNLHLEGFQHSSESEHWRVWEAKGCHEYIQHYGRWSYLRCYLFHYFTPHRHIVLGRISSSGSREWMGYNNYEPNDCPVMLRDCSLPKKQLSQAMEIRSLWSLHHWRRYCSSHLPRPQGMILSLSLDLRRLTFNCIRKRLRKSREYVQSLQPLVRLNMLLIWLYLLWWLWVQMISYVGSIQFILIFLIYNSLSQT